MSAEELNERFGIPEAARFEAGRGGLTRLVMTAGGGQAHVYLLGAHVTHWQPAGGEPVIWLSEHSAFSQGTAIRGGVPVCFPWFAAKADDPGAPMHGYVRLMEWDVESVEQSEDGSVTAAFSIRFGAAMGPTWPGDFEARHTVTLGESLKLSLQAVNHGRGNLVITEALHSYFRVSDVRKVSLRGLEGAEYFDKVAGQWKTQPGGPLTFSGQTDSVYRIAGGCVLDDPPLGRSIVVAKAGSNSTVVWNPWADKARAMPDFGDDEWPGMLCVETANALTDAVTVRPGRTHTMTAEITSAPLGAAVPEAAAPPPDSAPASPADRGAEVADWTQFTASVYVRASVAAVFEAWATRAGLTRWFLESAEFRPPGEAAARGDGVARSGDRYRWTWLGSDEVMEGTIEGVVWPEGLSFTFGQAGHCRVCLRGEGDETVVEVVQTDLPSPAVYADCNSGCTFYLTNLKSVLEGGPDLRDPDTAHKSVVNR